MEHSRQNSRWDLVPGMCPERFRRDLCPRSRAGFEGGFGTPGSLGINHFPEKQPGKSLGRLNPAWSEFQDLPSPLDRSTAPISAASAFPEPLEHLGITGAAIQVGNGAERTRPRTFLPSG